MQSFNRIKLKVCGMRDPDNIRAVADLHPDFMGFIFYPFSRRFVGNDFEIPEDFPLRTKRVGVFVNESTEKIATLIKKHKLDYVQLHGGETAAQCEELRATGVGVIKVFSIDNTFDFKTLVPYKLIVDFFLFDTKGGEYGGTGKTFDWQILKKYDQEIPFFLSGGLSPENIDDVVQLKGMNIYALDVNSGIEIKPGLKDIALLEALQMKRLKKLWLEY